MPDRKPSSSSAARPTRSKIVAVVSDIHFDLHHEPTWLAFRKWHARVKPWKTVVLGDFLDLGMMSKYLPESHQSRDPIAQIECFVGEMKLLAPNTQELIVVEGNHDERWGKYLAGAAPDILKRAKGLSLKDQCDAHGMPPCVWSKEHAEFIGYRVGPFILRHGHKQASKFGGKLIASSRAAIANGQSEVLGHHHKGQMFCLSSNGRTTVVVANPCMTGNHDYAVDANWQRGFTVIEVMGEHEATAYPIIVQNGRFAWAGRVYDGNRP